MSRTVTLCTGATDEYRPMVDLLARQSRALGYQLRAYDLGGLGVGVPWTQVSLDGWSFKPGMILDCLDCRDTPVVYMDADAVLFRGVGDVFEQPFDVAVTVRDKRELDGKDDDGRAFMGWTNAGVLFFENTPGARRFIRHWQSVMDRQGLDDQTALNQILYPTGKWPGHYRMLEQTRPIQVLTLPGVEFNYRGDAHKRPAETRIMHLHSGRWRQFLSDLREFGQHIPSEVKAA